MKIDLTILQKIGRAAPNLTVADYAASLAETAKEFKREQDRERINAKRKTEKTARQSATSSDNERHPATQSDMERQLFTDANRICGRNARGMVAKLLKHHDFQVGPVRAVLEAAEKLRDPRGYVAAACRRANGSRTGLMEAFDDLIDRAGGDAVGGDAEIRDITPGSADPS